MDYAKGILERLRAIEFLLVAHPSYSERFTFLQITAPADETVEKNRQFTQAVEDEVERINARFQKNGWEPIVLVNRYHTHEQIRPLYAAADVCLVTSLNDAMNLVAKEYVAAHDDALGALVLSQFTGAARDLKGAFIVNPYSAEETAEAIHKALSLPPVELRRRMVSMRNTLRDYNVYRWSAEFIKALAQIE
jgi:trehalose 6-phosphate synthase